MVWRFALLAAASMSFSPASGVAHYAFEATIEARDLDIAPVSLQQYMVAATGSEFHDCVGQLGLSDTLSASYFGSVALPVSDTGRKSWLILPGEACYAFFGAHAIEFWVVERTDENQFRILHTGRQDALTLSDDFHNGYRDLVQHAGETAQRLRFNGSNYLPVTTEGESN